MIKKIFRFFVVFLIVVGMAFSDFPFYVFSEAIDSYIEARNIVDVAWNAQKDDNVVDKFASLRSLPEKLKIHEARAATTFINVAHYNSASSSSAAVNKPANTANGDIMFAVIMRNAVVDPSTVPAGWNLAGNRLSTYGRWLYWKVANNEGTSYTWGWAAAAKTAITIATYRGGFDTSNPIDVVSNTAYTTSNATVRAASMNVAAADSVLLNFATFYSTTVRTFTKPSVPSTAWAENYDGGATSSDFSRTIDSMSWTGSGATGNIDTTCSATGTTVKHAFAVALRPPSVVVIPTVTTQAAGSVEVTTATGNGNITATGGANATRRGFCYMTGTSGDPTTANSVAYDDGSFGTGAYTKGLTGLSPGTSYRVRAYAVNSAGTGYGTTVQILTKPAAPTGVAATDGSYTDKVTITWTKSTGATDYHVWRDSTDLGAAGDVATFDDTGAGAPSITAGSSLASDGTSSVHVSLSLSGASVNNGTTHTYKVVASNATGNSADSATNTGYRGYGTAGYQWQRSAVDSDASYSDIAGATAASYNDTGAPANGDGRYYKCVLSATGASSQTSLPDRGYRNAGSLAADIVDSGGTPVGSPSVSFGGETFDWAIQQSAGTLGSASQKIRVTNTTATPGWTLSVSATSGPTALWQSGGNNYDFNGAQSAGRLRVDASGGTITPQGGCSATGLTKGSATYFVQGSQDSVTLVTAGGSAQTNCYWDITGMALTQDIPASQVPGSYSLGMTLTVS